MLNDIKLLTIYKDGQPAAVTVTGQPLLLDVLRDNGYAVNAPCSGDGRCGQCRVLVDGHVSPPDGRELELLGDKVGEDGYDIRLACRVRLLGDARVRLNSADSRHKLSAQELPAAIPADYVGDYGVAVDLGTTTVGLRAVDLSDGRALAQICALNDQRVCGADVMTRIACCDRDNGLDTLHRLIASQLTRMITLIGSDRDPKCVIIAGNTVMLHLLAGIDPSHIGKAPYHTREHFGRYFDARTLGMPWGGWLMPCIGGFTGGDLTAALLALTHRTELCEGLALCDLGTNGEMAVFDGDRWIVASSAAGPALEGGGISCGSGAVKGAVTALRPSQAGDALRLTSAEDADSFAVECDVMGGGRPVSLTGSALISLTALLLREGKIAPSGLMEAEEWNLGEDIAYTRGDVRLLQLAKGAVGAALLRLFEEYKDVKNANQDDNCLHIGLHITGGLGCQLEPADAAAIGLTPIPEGGSMNVCFEPNLALEGAVLCLEEKARERALAIAAGARVLELTDDERFDRLFVSCMRLGEPEEDF